MLRWVVATSLRARVLVVGLAATLLILGIPSVGDMPLDVFPEFAPPLVEIQTEAPGLSAEEVESLITVPIESAVNGTAWLEVLRSKSVMGLSSVVLIFERGTDLMRARQLVQERIALVTSQLPSVGRSPVLLSPLSATSRVMKIGLASQQLSPMELSTLARWTVRPRLLAVPGVANVAIWGQRDRQLQVLVHPDRLLANGVTLEQVVRAAQSAVDVGSGGFIDTVNQRLAVNHRSSVLRAEDLAEVVADYRQGTLLRLGDVADVVEGHPALIGDAVIDGDIGILLIVEKEPWGNTLDVTHGVEQALEAMRPGLLGVHVDSTIFRPATFIEMSISNLQRALALGCLFVVFVLVAFLWDWRTAFVSATAIPVSLLSAVVMLHFWGATLNTMVLAGLVIAIGEVVDDAIVDVENIVRRLRLNGELPEPRSRMRVVLEASLEVRSAVVFATAIVVLVLVPVFFLPGLSGTFFRPLATAYVLAVVASLVVALTLTPALCLLLLPGKVEGRAESRVVERLKAAYRRLLPRLMFSGKSAAAGLAFLFVLSLAVGTQLGQEFLPRFKEYDFLMHWVGKPGTSVEAMNRITIRVSEELLEVPGVRNFGAHVGRAEVADEVVGPEFTELWISLSQDVDYDATVASIQEIVDGYPGLYRDLLTYLRERIKEVLTGASASVVVRIYGPELDGLRDHALKVERAIAEVAGVVDLKVEPQIAIPHLSVELMHAEAGRFGLTPEDVRSQVTTLLQGRKVGEIFDEQKVFDVVVWGVPELRNDPGALRRLPLDTPEGGQVPLGEVARVRLSPTPSKISREGASRRIDVTCNVRGRDLGSVAREIKEHLAGVSFARGYHPELIGEYQELQEAQRRLLALVALVLFGIYLLLHTEFDSMRDALLLFGSLPFALVGGVFAAFLTGGVLSLGSLIGFVTVLGISARNGILLVSHYRHLAREEGVARIEDIVLRGSEERLAPILMTALTTALALLPVIAGGARPGQEIEHPMAVVIVGGLVTSTALNLLVMPALYMALHRSERE